MRKDPKILIEHIFESVNLIKEHVKSRYQAGETF
jgi:hypothetical protein